MKQENRQEILTEAFMDVSTRISLTDKEGSTSVIHVFSDELSLNEITFIVKYLKELRHLNVTRVDDETYDIDWKHFSINIGDQVRYIGTGLPKFTGQVLKVKSVLKKGLTLELPEEEHSTVYIEGGGTWGSGSLICEYVEVEVLEQ